MSSNRRASFPVNVLRRSPRRRTKTPSVNELPKKCSEYTRSLFLLHLYVLVSSNVVNLMFWSLAVDANYRDAALWSCIVVPSSLLGLISVNETVVEWRHFVLYFDDDGFRLPWKTSTVWTTLLRLPKIGSCGFECLVIKLVTLSVFHIKIPFYYNDLWTKSFVEWYSLFDLTLHG